MVRFPRLDDPQFPPKVDPLTREFQDDQYDIEERARAQEGPGRFAEPRINPRVEDIEDERTGPALERPLVQPISTRSGNHAQRLEELSQELFNRPWADLDDTQNRALWDEAEYRSGEHYRQIAPQGRSIGTRESTNVVSDREVAADAIIQAAQDLASQGWEPTRWNTDILRMPEEPQTNFYGQAHPGQLPYDDSPPTLGNRMQQPVRSPIPGIAVDSSGQQYPVQNVPPPNAVQALGAGAVLNVPLITTGFSLAAYETIFQKFPELVDMLASGKYRTDDPEIISRATDVAGIVTSGSFANRIAQDAGRARQQRRTFISEETGEPFYRPDDITLNINSTRDGRFNVDAAVGGEQAVDLYVRRLRTQINDPNEVLQFGHAYIDEPWQRQGIASAVQEHLEAVTGKPFVPDSFLTEAAYARWQKLDPDSLVGHTRQQSGDEVYYQRSIVQDAIDGRPWTETARMAEVRRAHAAGELESPLGPNGEFTLRGAQQTPKAPILGMGAATDSGLGGGARPRNLDRAGYYSHAEETVGNLQQRRGTPQQMWASIEKQIKEPEIRQLGLDEAVLGPALAGSRRFVVDQTADLARFRQELKELGTGEGQERWIARRYGSDWHKKLENSTYFYEARQRQAELQRMIPAREEALRGHVQRHEDRVKEISGTRASVNRDDILAAIQERRPQVRETSYGVYQRLTEPQIRDARAAMAGPGKDWSLFINELVSNPNWYGGRDAAGATARLIRDELDAGGKHLGATINSLAHHHGVNPAAVAETLHKLTGHSLTDFSVGTAPAGTRPLKVAKVTLDPTNPTLRWRTLSVQGESNSTIENLWRSIPDAEARTLRAVWGRDSDNLAGGLTPNQLRAVEELRYKHKIKLDRIRGEEARGNFIDPHFEETNIFGHYASSLQNLPDGGVTLNVSQLQSSWFDKIRAGQKLPEHGLVANQEAWLDPILRRIIKDATDQGATSITLPSADTVFNYNPPGGAREGLTRFYDETVPRRLRAMMREIDDGYTSRGNVVDELRTLSDPTTQYREEGLHSGTLRRIDGRVQDVRHGFRGHWLKFDLTPFITRHHRQGRGMRLQSAGVPVTGEEDGSEE